MKILTRPRRSYKPMGMAIKSKTIGKDTLKDIVDKVKEMEHPFFTLYFENLFLLSFETGARISEILPLQETDLDLRYGIVHYVVRKKRKKPIETTKHLTPELLDRFREHVKQYRFQIDQSNGCVFFGMSSKSQHITVRCAERHFEMARDHAGHGSTYGRSKPLYKITNVTETPQQFNLYGMERKDGVETEIITNRIMLRPGQSTVRAVDPKRYEEDKRFKFTFSHSKQLRRCTIHSIRHLSLQTVLEEKGLFEAYDHADHVSITSTMEYLEANPVKRKSRSAVFREFYGLKDNSEKTPKMQHSIGEIPETVDVSSMAKMFSQMAEFLNGIQEKEKTERLSEEFETAMKLKAAQEHKKAFAGNGKK